MFCYHQIAYICIIICNIYGKRQHDVNPVSYFYQYVVFGTQRPFAAVIEKPNPSAFLTKDPFEILSSGEYNHVPLFIGYNSHEGLIFEYFKKINPELDKKYNYRVAVPWFMKATNKQVDKIEEMMSNFYSKVEPLGKTTILMDSVFLSTIVASIMHHIKTSKCPVYLYRISVDCQRNYIKRTLNLQAYEGTCHADELGFLWNIQSLPKIKENTLEFLTVQRFVKFWTNFAATGNPTPSNDFNVTLRPTKEKTNISILNIGKCLTILKDFPERERIDLWENIFGLSQDTASYLQV